MRQCSVAPLLEIIIGVASVAGLPEQSGQLRRLAQSRRNVPLQPFFLGQDVHYRGSGLVGMSGIFTASLLKCRQSKHASSLLK
jgi:hypothetical protein